MKEEMERKIEWGNTRKIRVRVEKVGKEYVVYRETKDGEWIIAGEGKPFSLTELAEILNSLLRLGVEVEIFNPAHWSVWELTELEKLLDVSFFYGDAAEDIVGIEKLVIVMEKWKKKGGVKYEKRRMDKRKL